MPPGKYKKVGYESRQVFDIEISRVVTEYQAEILEDSNGNHFVAPFPEGVTKAVQYGGDLKAHSVYMSQYQLIPYKRIQEYFSDQLGIPVSEGSIYNFNQEAYGSLEPFEVNANEKLAGSALLHADETGININGDRHWLHSASNDLWTNYFPHKSRGSEAMDSIGILPLFGGVLCHDHAKAYYKYSCIHSLCNAHHIRELEGVWENDKHQWARDTKSLLEEMNRAVNEAGGVLEAGESERYRQKYRLILKNGEAECPPLTKRTEKGKGAG